MSDVSYRKLLKSRLSGADFDNLWLKVSGFGNNATSAGIRKYIEGASGRCGIHGRFTDAEKQPIS
jgi:hypothetical protein